MTTLRPASLALVVAFGAAALAGCSPEPAEAQVALRLLRGDADPLMDPGSPTRSAAPITSLRVSWLTDGTPLQRELPVSAAGTALHLPVKLGSPAQVSVEGLRVESLALYSAARSPSFVPTVAHASEVTAFFGPVESFTGVGPALAGSFSGFRTAALGESGALVLGEQVTPGSTPGGTAWVYRLSEGRLCSGADGCLSGVEPPTRSRGIAVATPDGVVHGLGRLASGSLDRRLYLTTLSGETSELTLGGDALDVLEDAAAVVLPSGGVMIVGGATDSGPSTGLGRVDVRARTFIKLAPLKVGRRAPGVALLVTGEVLVVGGEDGTGPNTTVEVVDLTLGSKLVEGEGSFPQVRNRLRGPRVAPVLERMADDGVLILGGGTADGEVFKAELGAVGGLVDLVAPPTALRLQVRAALRVRSEVLLTGTDGSGTSERALLFTPDPSQLLSAASPSYVGAYRAAGPLSAAGGNLTLLADQSVLCLAGGRAQVLVPQP